MKATELVKEMVLFTEDINKLIRECMGEAMSYLVLEWLDEKKRGYSSKVTLTKKVILVMDVVESDMPLLLSKNVLRKAQIKIDLARDDVTLFGI